MYTYTNTHIDTNTHTHTTHIYKYIHIYTHSGSPNHRMAEYLSVLECIFPHGNPNANSHF